MKAIRVHAPGGIEALRYEDAPEPVAGPGEVLVQNRAIGVNFIDTYFRSGLYPTEAPFILGNEAAGEVIAVGAGVSGFRKGDPVAYAVSLGAYAERRAVKATQLVKVPAGVSHDDAASLMLKGMTAEYLLHRTFRLKPGHVALVHAAAGATGQIVARWAKNHRRDRDRHCCSPEKGAIARAAGCDLVINYRDGGFAAAVHAFTRGGKCDVVYDGVGKATFMESLDCLKPFGLMVSFGNASGPVDAFNLGILAGKGSLLCDPTDLVRPYRRPENPCRHGEAHVHRLSEQGFHDRGGAALSACGDSEGASGAREPRNQRSLAAYSLTGDFCACSRASRSRLSASIPASARHRTGRRRQTTRAPRSARNTLP